MTPLGRLDPSGPPPALRHRGPQRTALPEIEGLAERCGQSVFHCPYCHGLRARPGPHRSHRPNQFLDSDPPGRIALIPEWGAVTFYTTKF